MANLVKSSASIKILRYRSPGQVHLPILSMDSELKGLYSEANPSIIFNEELRSGSASKIERPVAKHITVHSNDVQSSVMSPVETIEFSHGDASNLKARSSRLDYSVGGKYYWLDDAYRISIGYTEIEFATHELPTEILNIDSVDCSFWRRLNGKYVKDLSYTYCDYQGIEIEGLYFYYYDEGSVLSLSHLDEVRPDFIFGSSDPMTVVSKGEALGYGDGESYQIKYTTYLNLGEEVTVCTFTNPLSEDSADTRVWNVVEDLRQVDDLSYACEIDYNMGIIRFGWKESDPFKLAQDIDADSTSIVVVDGQTLPEKGIIILDNGEETETVLYNAKIGNVLLGLERSDPYSFVADDTFIKIKACGRIPEPSDYIYAGYTAYPWLTFSQDQGKSNEANYRYDLHRKGKAIYVASNRPESAYKITLKVLDRSSYLMGSRLVYGPTYANDALVVIEGQVLDAFDYPVANKEVTLYSTEGGIFEYAGPEIKTISNDDGLFWVTYMPERSLTFNPVYAFDSDVTFEEGSVIMNFNYPENIRLAEEDLNLLHLYVLTKDDPVLGYTGTYYNTDLEANFALPVISDIIGTPMDMVDSGISVENGGLSSFIVLRPELMDAPDDFVGGAIRVRQTLLPFNGTEQATVDTVCKIVSVKRAGHYLEGSGLKGSGYVEPLLITIDKELPIEEVQTIQEVWMFRKEESEFSPAELNGRLRVLSVKAGVAGSDGTYTPWIAGDSYDDTHSESNQWLHPSIDAEGYIIYKPVTPVSRISENVYEFAGELPVPQLNNRKNNVAGYALFGSRLTEVHAECKSTDRHGIIIDSNHIFFMNSPSPRDRGTVTAGDNYVPYGFRLKSSGYEGSSTISGPTYLTLNSPNHSLSSGSIKGPMLSLVDANAIIYSEDTIIKSSIPRLVFEIELTS